MNITIFDLEQNILQAGAKLVQFADDGFFAIYKDLQIIVSEGKEQDSNIWYHVSATKRYISEIPSYNDLCEIKQILGLNDYYAYQIFAPENKHVNIHPHVLHLWCCKTKNNYLPDFTRGQNTI